MAGFDQALAKTVAQMILLHEVSQVTDYTWGKEIVPHCFSCGYFGDVEDPALHTANVVLEYVEEHYKERFSHEAQAQENRGPELPACGHCDG